MFTWAVDHDLISRSPCRGIRLPGPEARPRPFASVADIERLADALPIEYRVAVFLGALGLRQAEVFGLCVGSVDFVRGTLTVEHTINEVRGRIVEGRGKTAGSVRTITVPGNCSTSSLDTWRRRAGPTRVISSSKPRVAGPWRATNFRLRVYNPATETAG